MVTVDNQESAEPQEILMASSEQEEGPQRRLSGEDATGLYVDQLQFGYFVPIWQHQSLLSPP